MFELREGQRKPSQLSLAAMNTSSDVEERIGIQLSDTFSKTKAQETSTTEKGTSKFSRTLQETAHLSTADTFVEVPEHGLAERVQWVLNPPEPPGPWSKMQKLFKDTFCSQGDRCRYFREPQVYKSFRSVFPILSWGKSYNLKLFRSDVLAGLTLASLCIPQGIGYATLAKLDPQYGLYTSVVPPLLYAVMGTSKDIAIGPVAVVSLLVSMMVQKLEDPVENPAAYRRLVMTATFFAGIFQATFGIFRLGFLVDFLSHAAIVGFMGGAAIIIGLQQLKGLLGISNFTNNTDIISVLTAVWKSVHYSWNPLAFILGCSFLSFILISRFLGQKKKKLFWLSTTAPLVSVMLSTLIVYLTRADRHGLKIVKHIKPGLNPSSVHELQFNGQHTAEVVKIGLVAGIVALTEAIAVGRSFASVKGYHLDGNKEMVAIGAMNVAGSLSSCYVATGSFSRTAVNVASGCKTAVSNAVMAVTVMIVLVLLTGLLYYTPVAILASVILSALPGLIDLREAYNIWKIDKSDFLACFGAFLGVLFGSVEIGLLVAVGISLAKVVFNSIQPGIETLGKLPGTEVFVDIDQYPVAEEISGVLVTRLRSGLLCFANASTIEERIIGLATKKMELDSKANVAERIYLLVFDLSNLTNIDTSGIYSLEELHKSLSSEGIEFAVINPRWEVIHKLRMTKFLDKVGKHVYVSVGEAIEACLSAKMMA